MRALPGNVSPTRIHAVAGSIEQDSWDSYYENLNQVDTYVIRRAYQTLPCFVIHY
jgi:hypothetical protein